MFNSLEHVEHIQELEKRFSLDFKSVMGGFRDYLCGVNMMLNNFEISIRFYPLNGPLQWEQKFNYNFTHYVAFTLA